MSDTGTTDRAPFGYIRDAGEPTDAHFMECGIVDADGTLHIGRVSIERAFEINLLTAAALSRHRQRAGQGGAS